MLPVQSVAITFYAASQGIFHWHYWYSEATNKLW